MQKNNIRELSGWSSTTQNQQLVGSLSSGARPRPHYRGFVMRNCTKWDKKKSSPLLCKVAEVSGLVDLEYLVDVPLNYAKVLELDSVLQV